MSPRLKWSADDTLAGIVNALQSLNVEQRISGVIALVRIAENADAWVDLQPDDEMVDIGEWLTERAEKISTLLNNSMRATEYTLRANEALNDLLQRLRDTDDSENEDEPEPIIH